MKAATKVLLLCQLLLATRIAAVRAQQDQTVRDKDINVIDFEDLQYPSIAQTANVQGVVVIKVTLDDQGNVVNAQAISGPDLLTRACLDNARKWKFEPNSQKSAVLVYNFRIKGSCHRGQVSSQFIWQRPNFATITGCERTL